MCFPYYTVSNFAQSSFQSMKLYNSRVANVKAFSILTTSKLTIKKNKTQSF